MRGKEYIFAYCKKCGLSAPEHICKKCGKNKLSYKIINTKRCY